MNPFNILSWAGIGLSAYGAYTGGQQAQAYYNQAAGIQAQNAGISWQNSQNKAAYDLQVADINEQNAAITLENKNIQADYDLQVTGINERNAAITLENKTIQATYDLSLADIQSANSALTLKIAGINAQNQDKQLKFEQFQTDQDRILNNYLHDQSMIDAQYQRDLANRIYANTVGIATQRDRITDQIAAENLTLQKEKLASTLENQEDLARHSVAEQVAAAARGGFSTDGGSNSYFSDVIQVAEGSAVETYNYNSRAAEITNRETTEMSDLSLQASILGAGTSRDQNLLEATRTETTAARYSSAATIDLAKSSLIDTEIGSVWAKYGVAESSYGLDIQGIEAAKTRIAGYLNTANQTYGLDIQGTEAAKSRIAGYLNTANQTYGLELAGIGATRTNITNTLKTAESIYGTSLAEAGLTRQRAGWEGTYGTYKAIGTLLSGTGSLFGMANKTGGTTINNYNYGSKT